MSDELLVYFVIAQLLQLGQLQASVTCCSRERMAFIRARLEAVADSHDLAGGLHLGAQGTAGGGELIKGQAGDLQDAVVQGGLKAGGWSCR